MTNPHPRIRDYVGQQRKIRGGAATAAKAVACLIALAFFFYLLQTILLPFVLAGIVAFICDHLVRWLQRRLRWSRTACAIMVLIGVLTIVAICAWLALPPLTEEIQRVSGKLHPLVEGFLQKFLGSGSVNMFGATITAKQAADEIVNGMHSWFGQSGNLIKAAAYTFSGAFGCILTLVLFGFFLLDARRISSGMFWLVPPSYRPFAAQVWSELAPVLRRYFVGIGLVVLYATCAAYIGLGLFLGLQHAILLAILTGFLEVIPLVGPAASAIIAGLVAVEEASSAGAIIAYAIYATALRISIDQFFGPLVLGRAGRIPPVLVIFCFLAGGFLYGLVGVVIAVPTALSIRTILRVLYDEAPQKS
jgi:predicted PurR-regulated permease PerM